MGSKAIKSAPPLHRHVPGISKNAGDVERRILGLLALDRPVATPIRCVTHTALNLGYTPCGRAIANLSKESSKDSEQVIVVPASAETLVFDTNFGRALLFETIESDVAEDGEIMCAVVFA